MKKNIRFYSFIVVVSLVLLASCSKNEVTNITLNKSTANYTIGQTDSLISTISASGDLDKYSQTWTTSNSSVATVKNGLVTAINVGTVSISVQAGGKKATCEVTVTDKINPALTKGILGYYGDVYGTASDTIPNNESKNFVIYLAGAGVNLNNYFAGTDDRVMIEVNTPTSATDVLPSGTYDIMTQLSQGQLLPYTIVPAYQASGEPWGTWYFGSGSNDVVAGNIVVSQSNSIYTIQYNLIDYYGNTISGTYQGTLVYYDGTTASASPVLKNKIKLHSTATVVSSLNLKRR